MSSGVKQLKDLKFSPSRKIFSLFVGHYLSTFKGQGIDYDESRHYVPGDNIRDIDWISTAKTGELFVKKYIETRELNILFAVDASSSLWLPVPGGGGMPAKVREAVTWLCLAANYSQDRLGLILFTDQLQQFINFKKGQPQTVRLLRQLDDLSRRPTLGWSSNVSGALREILNKVKQRTVCFLILDFLAEEDFAEISKKLTALSKRHQLIVLRASSLDYIAQLPFGQEIELQDAETGQTRKLLLTREFLSQIQSQEAKDLKKLKQFCLSRRIGFLNLQKESNLLLDLIQCLRQVRNFYLKP